MTKLPSDLRIASDGLPARIVRPWAEEKLFYIQRYIDIFSTGMKAVWLRRVYVDLFSGPGLCVIDDTQREIPGSPLLAAKAKFPFTNLFLNDVDMISTRALRTRLARFADETTTTISTRDCNAAARQAVLALELDLPRTIGLVVADPTAFQSASLHWTS